MGWDGLRLSEFEIGDAGEDGAETGLGRVVVNGVEAAQQRRRRRGCVCRGEVQLATGWMGMKSGRERGAQRGREREREKETEK